MCVVLCCVECVVECVVKCVFWDVFGETSLGCALVTFNDRFTESK